MAKVSIPQKPGPAPGTHYPSPDSNIGKGRKPGVPNKVTRSVRETFERVFVALQEEGGPASLKAFADRKPEAFYQLAARLIPAQVALSVSGTINARLLEARKVTGK